MQTSGLEDLLLNMDPSALIKLVHLGPLRPSEMGAPEPAEGPSALHPEKKTYLRPSDDVITDTLSL